MLDVQRRHRIASGLEVSPDESCEVKSVVPNSPAAKAGLRPGDVITQFADRPTPTSLDYHLALVNRKAGEPLPVKFTREGKPQTVSLALAARPKPDAAAEPAKAKTMGLRSASALLVTSVDASVYGKVQHQPQPGDVLARIGLIRPRNPEHAAELVEDLQPGQAIDLVYLRRRENTATRIDVHLVLPAAAP
jgi:membrane-associated protease RseP (regulator of RpoE activity)